MEADPAGTKRKSEAEPDAAEAISPQRRGGGALTLDAVTALFAQQTRDIRESTSSQINAAIKNLEEKTLKRIDLTEERMTEMVKSQDNKIQEVQRTTEGLLERVKALESRPAGSADSTATGSGERLALVVGGWKPETHRDHILADFQSLTKELDVSGLLDGEYFVPGIRANVAIVPIMVRPGESEQQTRQRMSKVIQIVRDARMQTQHIPDDATIWAAMSRPKAARLLAARAGKVRKCLYMLEVNAKRSECEYSSGTVWLGGVLLASATRQAPARDTVLQGKVANSWVDAQAVANAVPCAIHRVETAWKAVMES